MKSKKIVFTVGQQSITIRCTSKEEDGIQKIATILSNKINSLREKTGISDRERLTIMAALMVINEIKDADTSPISDETLETIHTLNQKMQGVIERTQ